MRADRIADGRLVQDLRGAWRVVTGRTSVPPDQLLLRLEPPPAWLVGAARELQVVRLDRDDLFRLTTVRGGRVRVHGEGHDRSYWDTAVHKQLNPSVLTRLATWGLVTEIGDGVFASRAGMTALKILKKEE